MNKTSIIAITLASAGAAALAGLVPAAEAAAPKADVIVTITAEGTDMSGVVTSTASATCAADRTVKIFKLIKGESHLFTADTTDLQGGKYVWSTGNTGQAGRFFAKVGGTPDCQSDVSPTIRVRRNN